MRNIHQHIVKQGLRALMRDEKDSNKKAFIKGLIETLERADTTYEKWIFAAKMIGYHNPSFDGDEIGYPDDDLDR